MNEAKIRLSPKEAELVCDADLILTKNHILEKATHLLEILQEEQQSFLRSIAHLPAEVLQIPPKISRGENYNGLPYRILDQPRYFNKNDVFAVRGLFWWGKCFSITLHLSGKYKEKYEGRIAPAYWSLQDAYYCISENEWEHHFEKDNYVPVKEINPAEFKAMIKEKSFIKLATKLSLEQWDNAIERLSGDFKFFIMLLEEV